jgi:hypothetical protein
MSALETFVRIRQYKDRAAEFFGLAAHSFSLEVRARYLAIADHYMALAEAETRADRLTRKQRLEHMRSEREKSQRTASIPAAALRPEPPAAVRMLRPAAPPAVKSAKRPAQRKSTGAVQMAAQANFTAAKSAR